ncbi:MAG: HTTM domain-containing protein, partial [Deltaproteobacteria bacterium]
MSRSADETHNFLTPEWWFGKLDLRPLGLMRITFGCIVLLATADILPILFDILSDTGVMPRSALLGGIARANRICVMDIAGPHWVCVAIWLLAMLATLAFTLGFHTRVATVATFVLVSSLHERNLLAFDGADNVIRVMLFWLMFMPAGARYSLDSLIRRAKGQPTITHAAALPMRLGQFQIAWLYLNSLMHKWGGTTWHDGTALHQALGLDHLFTRSLGHLLFNQAWFYVPGTYFTVLVEGSFLALVFLPFFQPYLKAIAIAMGTALHAGIWATMNIGNFSYLMPACYVLLFEPEWAET